MIRLLQTQAKESTRPSSVRLVWFKEGSKGVTYFKANILYYVTNKGYHPAFKQVQQLAPPENIHGLERIGDNRKSCPP